LTGETAETTRPVRPASDERDGRRLRSQDSRARIVSSMLGLIREGEVSPSAEQVAARANVGLRTVFRHFKDMDSLYREMSEVIEAEVHAIRDQPFIAADWRGRVLELIDRRFSVFEKIAPFKRASDAYRHRSRFLGADNTRLVIALREILEAVAPAGDLPDPRLMEALDLLLSFEAWSRLRREQGLSQAEARDALHVAVERLIA
jgi:AcrR family transcriptional regulator